MLRLIIFFEKKMEVPWTSIFLFVVCLSMSYSQYDIGYDTTSRCEDISIALCKDIEYNQTIMPNLLNHQTQDEAGLEVHQFFPLVKVNCSRYLKFFLCTMYVPICTIIAKPLPPCRSLCNAARHGCESLMNDFGVEWPNALHCSRFPEYEDEGLCVGQYEGPRDPRPEDSSETGGNSGGDIESDNANNRYGQLECPAQYKVNDKLDYYIEVIDDNRLNHCGIACDVDQELDTADHVFFNSNQRQYLRYWIGGWAALCFFSTLFTVTTFAIDMQRFRYPERPIIFLSGCYLIVSATYLVGVILRDDIACTGPFRRLEEDAHVLREEEMEKVVAQGTKHSACTIAFMILYFFSMSSSIWWVVLTLTWFLAAGMKWGHEAIEANSQYFHLAAWAVPAIKTIAILTMGKVDGDVLSGVCFTGISDVDSLRGFVIAPLVVYFVVGTFFLLAGFISLFKIRTVMKTEGTKTDKLEKLMVRIGIFSLLYTIPALVIIGCYFYEQSLRYEWNTTWQAVMAEHEGLLGNPEYAEDGPRPALVAFFLKYLMLLVVGVLSGFWIWTKKTVNSWANFWNRLCGNRPPPPQRV